MDIRSNLLGLEAFTESITASYVTKFSGNVCVQLHRGLLLLQPIGTIGILWIDPSRFVIFVETNQKSLDFGSELLQL